MLTGFHREFLALQVELTVTFLPRELGFTITLQPRRLSAIENTLDSADILGDVIWISISGSGME